MKSSGGGITLSKKHGLNPSVVVCPVCGESVSVALYGAYGGKEAPRKTTDLQPCDKCKAEFTRLAETEGLVVVIIHDDFEKAKLRNSEITPWPYFCGYVVLSRESADRVFNGDIAEKPMAFISYDLAQKVGIIAAMEKASENNERIGRDEQTESD